MLKTEDLDITAEEKIIASMFFFLASVQHQLQGHEFVLIFSDSFLLCFYTSKDSSVSLGYTLPVWCCVSQVMVNVTSALHFEGRVWKIRLTQHISWLSHSTTLGLALMTRDPWASLTSVIQTEGHYDGSVGKSRQRIVLEAKTDNMGERFNESDLKDVKGQKSRGKRMVGASLKWWSAP